MTDFVDRLLGRSGVAPIRPLLPTLFEPTRRDDSDELPPGVFTPAAAPPLTVPRHPRDRDIPAAPPGAAAPLETQPSTNPVEVPDAIAPRSTVERHETRHTVTDHSMSTAVTEKTIIESRTEVSAPAVAEQPDLARPEPVAAEPYRAPGVPPVHRVAQLPAPRPVESVRREAVTPRRAPREPDVHVTIGRVEIRAEAPKSAGVPRNDQGRRRPRLSLEDYLRAREG